MDGLKEAMNKALGELSPQTHELLMKEKITMKEEALDLIDDVQAKLDLDEALVMDGKKSVIDHAWRHKTATFIKHKRREVQKIERQISEHKRVINKKWLL